MENVNDINREQDPNYVNKPKESLHLKTKEDIRQLKIIRELSIIKHSLIRLHKLKCALDIVDDQICLVDSDIQREEIDHYHRKGKYIGMPIDKNKYIISSFSNN